MNVTR